MFGKRIFIGSREEYILSRLSDVGCGLSDVDGGLSDVGCGLSDVDGGLSDVGSRLLSGAEPKRSRRTRPSNIKTSFIYH